MDCAKQVLRGACRAAEISDLHNEKRRVLMTRSRPFGVSALAVLALVAAVLAGIHTLQFLHLLPFFIGPVSFWGFDLLGAVLSGVIALIWLWAAKMLWEVDQQGWLFVTIVALLTLIFDVAAVIGGSALQAMLPAIIVSGLVLVYCLWPSTRDAFAPA
jgi:hypothetical protein